jgi:hypothetical protein
MDLWQANRLDRLLSVIAMNLPKRAARLRVLTATAALMTGAALLYGCGEDADTTTASTAPPVIAIAATESEGRMVLEAPGTSAPGLVELELSNRGRELHTAQLLRVEGNRSRQEVLAAYEGTAMGKPVPDWLFAVGGVGMTEPGRKNSVVQRLVPGTYWIVDDAGEEESNFTTGGFARLVVSGEPHSQVKAPGAGASVVASEYAFEAKGLHAGKGRIRFVNAGAEPHHLLAMPILAGNTVDDVTAAMKANRRPPVEIDEETASTVIEGGEELLLDVELKPGRYALLCFIADRAGGPPHAFKGMVGEAVVR